MNLNDKLWNELVRIINLVNTSEIYRMGKLFSTEKNNYFYDTGTGKVIELDDEAYYIFYYWYTEKDIAIENFISKLNIKENELAELLGLCLKENLLRAIKPKKLYTPNHFDNLNYLLDTIIKTFTDMFQNH